MAGYVANKWRKNPRGRSTARWLNRISDQACLALLLCGGFLISGCSSQMSLFQSAPQISIDLSEVLPTDWAILGNLREVNLDGDADIEYLLLYSYDGDPNDASNSGPIGALLYDKQLDSAFVTGDAPAELIPIPNQPAGIYVPYPILPNYWEMAVGVTNYTSADPYAPVDQFIAPPLTKDAEVIVANITRGGNLASDAGVEVGPDELLIYGGETHLTVVWWKNAFDGYGVVQLHAPYGFESFNWGDGGIPNQSPLQSVIGSFPLNDRSRLCRKVRYTRVLSPGDDGRPGSKPAITYTITALGIRFCDAIPTHPFYPEGVVLAYMLDPLNHGSLVEAVNEGDTSDLRLALNSQLNELQIETGLERIEDLQTRAAVPYPPRVPGGTEVLLTTNVCVAIHSLNNAQMLRQMRFILRYYPAKLATKVTDRWVIIDTQPQDLAIDQMGCRDFIQLRPPG